MTVLTGWSRGVVWWLVVERVCLVFGHVGSAGVYCTVSLVRCGGWVRTQIMCFTHSLLCFSSVAVNFLESDSFAVSAGLFLSLFCLAFFSLRTVLFFVSLS